MKPRLGSCLEQEPAQSFNLFLHGHFELSERGTRVGGVPGGKLTLRLAERIGAVGRDHDRYLSSWGGALLYDVPTL
jgi:hypothetical protein